MSREAQIPLVLWVSAAIVAHLAGGGGAIEVAQSVLDRESLLAIMREVRDGLRPPDTTFEILTDGVNPTAPQDQVAAPDKDSAASDDADPNAPAEKAEADKALAEKKDDAKADKTQPPEADKPKQPEPEKPKVEAVKPEIVKAAPPPPPQMDHRIAVRQNVDKNQEDNPSAARIADDANHTKEESVARIRSHDQDDPNPTPGSHASTGPKQEIGDSDHTKIAQSEDKAGEQNHAPGEKNDKSTTAEHHNPAPPAPPGPSSDRTAGAAGPGKLAIAPGRPSAPNAAPPPSPGGAGPASPELAEGARGYPVDPANPGGDGRSRNPGRRRPSTPLPYNNNAPRVGQLGLGAPGVPGGPNINLDQAGVVQAVGTEKLKQERAADGAARRSAHRGSWETNGFERWRAAIENYEPSVKLGNQTSLNAARVPFATYINTIHNRLHPIFAEEFLASLDTLPQSHTLNQDLITHVEIVLSKDEGRIVRMGITKASGVTAFDIVALNSISRASPFGKAPDAIVSPDGNVYLHWEFHRDPYDACTTRNARPFMLKSAPTLTPKAGAPKKGPGPTPSDERRPLLPTRDP